jgi:hypothetical protein
MYDYYSYGIYVLGLQKLSFTLYYLCKLYHFPSTN